MTDRPAALPAAFVCRWFAGLFLTPPDAAALAAYREGDGAALLAGLDADPALAGPVAELRALCADGQDLDRAARDLAAAHAAAFLVGGPRAAAPYASVWLSPRGLLNQAPARAMTRLLAEVGLSLPEGVSEPPDHLAFQLNLLAELAERSAAGAPVPITPEAFLHDHLGSWVPRFAEACATLRKPLLYAGLATALSHYLTDTIEQTKET